MLQQFVEEFPQLQVTNEIRTLVLKTLVGPVCGFLPLKGSIAWVLHA